MNVIPPVISVYQRSFFSLKGAVNAGVLYNISCFTGISLPFQFVSGSLTGMLLAIQQH